MQVFTADSNFISCDWKHLSQRSGTKEYFMLYHQYNSNVVLKNTITLSSACQASSNINSHYWPDRSSRLQFQFTLFQSSAETFEPLWLNPNVSSPLHKDIASKQLHMGARLRRSLCCNYRWPLAAEPVHWGVRVGSKPARGARMAPEPRA